MVVLAILSIILALFCGVVALDCAFCREWYKCGGFFVLAIADIVACFLYLGVL